MAIRRRSPIDGVEKSNNLFDRKNNPVGKKKSYFCHYMRVVSFSLLLITFLWLHNDLASISHMTTEFTMTNNPDNEKSSPMLERPLKCTMEQLMKVRSQLPPELCVLSHVNHVPFYQKCSITRATKCPKSPWIDQHYRERYNQHYESSPGSLAHNKKQSFVGISIGCNKGFDAINTFRMGIFDASINKSVWNLAMTNNGTDTLHENVCNQNAPEDIFQIPQPDSSDAVSSNNQKEPPQGEMHCVEPMPVTYKMLSRSAENLGYAQKGFKVTHAAVSKQSGEMLFPSTGKVGIENQGLATCQKNKDKCVTVPVYSLKEFVEKNVKADKSEPINILSIDVEGFDGDVLLGATDEVLNRVEYLEFEYNWMGSWEKQHLYDIIEMLDATASMTCYWAGVERLWRITECWMSYFDIRTWSNIACVNRVRVPELASKMEDVFLHTIEEDYSDIVSPTVKNRAHKKVENHILMSLDEKVLRSKYIPSQKK